MANNITIETPICESGWSQLRTPNDKGWFEQIFLLDPTNKVEHKICMQELKKVFTDLNHPDKHEPWWPDRDGKDGPLTGKFRVRASTKDIKGVVYDIDGNELPVAPNLMKGSKIKGTLGVSIGLDRVTNKPSGWINLWLNKVLIVEAVEPAYVGPASAPDTAVGDFGTDDDIPF